MRSAVVESSKLGRVVSVRVRGIGFALASQETTALGFSSCFTSCGSGVLVRCWDNLEMSLCNLVCSLGGAYVYILEKTEL